MKEALLGAQNKGDANAGTKEGWWCAPITFQYLLVTAALELEEFVSTEPNLIESHHNPNAWVVVAFLLCTKLLRILTCVGICQQSGVYVYLMTAACSIRSCDVVYWIITSFEPISHRHNHITLEKRALDLLHKWM